MCLRTRISWDRGMTMVIRGFNLTKADYIYNEDCLAEGFAIRLEDPTEWGQAAINIGHEKQEQFVNRSRTAALSYETDNWIYLNLKNVKTTIQSKNLDWQHAKC